jgi:SAM-dependent methyltransferase
VSTRDRRVNQCQKPTGWVGRLLLRRMNASHSTLTDWGLGLVCFEPDATILDVGCGGGRTISKLAAIANEGKVYGVDFSEESVAASRKMNAVSIETGRVEIRHGSVSALPFPDNMFDTVTAVETHFWWPDLPGDLREILRVLKSRGQLALIAEIYKGANTLTSRLAEQQAARTGMTLLSVDEHRDLLAAAGFVDVQIDTDVDRGWICATGRKPAKAAIDEHQTAEGVTRSAIEPLPSIR